MNTNKILSIASVVLSVLALTATLYFNIGKKQIYYIDNGKLYDGFVLKKEYEKQIQTLRINRKNIIDSLEFELKKLQSLDDAGKFGQLKEEYVEKVRMFEEEEEGLLNEYNAQIWKRLNQYAIEYGKKNNIDFLLGTSGEGNLMHTKDEFNKTDELIAYANKRYNGK